jgi:hypothetical protein
MLAGFETALIGRFQIEPAALGFFPLCMGIGAVRLSAHTPSLYYRENRKSGKEKWKCSQKIYNYDFLESYFCYDTSHHQIVSYLDRFCLP